MPARRLEDEPSNDDNVDALAAQIRDKIKETLKDEGYVEQLAERLAELGQSDDDDDDASPAAAEAAGERKETRKDATPKDAAAAREGPAVAAARPAPSGDPDVFKPRRAGVGISTRTTRIFRGDESRRRRGSRVDIPWRRVAAAPRLPRGYSVATGRGGAAAATYEFGRRLDRARRPPYGHDTCRYRAPLPPLDLPLPPVAPPPPPTTDAEQLRKLIELDKELGDSCAERGAWKTRAENRNSRRDEDRFR